MSRTWIGPWLVLGAGLAFGIPAAATAAPDAIPGARDAALTAPALVSGPPAATDVTPATVPVPGAPEAAAPGSGLDEASDDLLLMPEPYYYESLGRRDIFVSLISEDYAKDNPNPRPVSDELMVVGILWGEKDRLALLETEDGRSMILREGDSLGDGTVSQILPDRVVVRVTEYGSSRTKSLPLVQGGGWNENPRSRNR